MRVSGFQFPVLLGKHRTQPRTQDTKRRTQDTKYGTLDTGHGQQGLARVKHAYSFCEPDLVGTQNMGHGTQNTACLEHGISLVMAFGVGLSGLLLALSLAYDAAGMAGGRLLAIWGILFLVSTPIVRVFMCLHHFTLQKDWKYIALTVWVLMAMALGVVVGAAG